MTEFKTLKYIFVIIFVFQNSFAQNKSNNKTLYGALEQAKTKRDKINAMLTLSNYYAEPTTSNLDSLTNYSHKILKLTQNDDNLQEKRADALNHLAFKSISLKQQDSAQYYIKTLRTISEKLNYGLGLTYTHHKASFYSQHIDYDTNMSIYHFQNAYKTAKKYKIPKHIIFDYGVELSYLYQLIQFNPDEISKILFEVADYIDEPGINRGVQGLFYRNLANVYKDTKVFDKAILNYQKAIEIYKEINSYQLGYALIDLAEIYYTQGNINKAITIFQQIVKLNFNNKRINPYYGLAYCYFDLKDYETSKKYYKKALAVYKSRNILDFEAACLKGLGAIYLKQKNKKVSDTYFDLAIDKYKKLISDKKKESKYRKTLIKSYNALSNIYEYKDQPTKSLKYYKLYAAHKDTLNKKQTLKVSERFAFFDKVSEKNKEIENLGNLNKIQELKAEKEGYIKIGLLIILVFIIIVLGILINRFRSKQKSLQLIKTKNEENTLLMQEIHHRVKNNLQIILSLLGTQMNNSDNKELKRILIESQNKIKSMAIIHQNLYNSNQFSKINVASYINDLITNIKKSYSNTTTAIKYDFDVIDQNIKISLAVPLGLIINELVTNAHKYAFANQTHDFDNTIKISFKPIENTIQYRLIITDNGKGLPNDFDVNNLNSYGLQLVYGLVSQLHGDIDIIQENGTSFNIIIEEPIN